MLYIFYVVILFRISWRPSRLGGEILFLLFSASSTVQYQNN